MFQSIPHSGVRRAFAAVGVLLAVAALAAQASSTATPVFAPVTQVISTGAPAYELDFTAATTETVDVSLTDLATAGTGSSGLTALSSVALAVTSGGALVDAASTTTPATLNAAGTVSIPAVAGTTYRLFVVGVPNPTATSGNAVSVQVASHTSGTSYAYGTHSFTVPAASVPQSVYFGPTPFTISTAGNYSVTVSDLAAPVALTHLVAYVLGDAPGSVGISVLPGTATPLPSLAAGTYKIYVYAVSDAAVQAGLLSIHLVPQAGGSAVLDLAVPVGYLAKAHADLQNPTAQSLTLSTADLLEPAALTTLDAVVTSGSQLLGQVGSGQSATFTAPAGTLSVWQLVTPASGGAGAYAIGLTPGLLAPSVTVVADPAGTLHPYAIAVPSAGNYVPALTDEVFPAAFSTLGYQIYQGGTQLGTGTAGAAAAAIALQAGTAVLVVNAVANSAGNGIYTAALTASGSSTSAFATVQSVGANLMNVPFTIPTSGTYDVTLTDLGWPAAFGSGSINGLISQSTATQGSGFPAKIYGAGTLSGISLPAGNYVATINGAPAAGQVAGTFTLAVVPSAPTVTLAASPASLTTGTGTKLTWSSTGASTCTASATGPVPSSTTFKGTQAATGTDDEGPFATVGTVTYTLACTGAGGSASASTTVTVTASSSGGGGGGGAYGAVDVALLVALGALRRRYRPAA